MKVYTIEAAEYSWDRHEIIGIYSTEEKANKALDAHLALLKELKMDHKPISIYVNDWELDESN
jgi:hypothetical protein